MVSGRGVKAESNKKKSGREKSIMAYLQKRTLLREIHVKKEVKEKKIEKKKGFQPVVAEGIAM